MRWFVAIVKWTAGPRAGRVTAVPWPDVDGPEGVVLATAEVTRAVHDEVAEADKAERWAILGADPAWRALREEGLVG